MALLACEIFSGVSKVPYIYLSEVPDALFFSPYDEGNGISPRPRLQIWSHGERIRKAEPVRQRRRKTMRRGGPELPPGIRYLPEGRLLHRLESLVTIPPEGLFSQSR